MKPVVFHVVGEKGEMTVAGLVDGIATFARGGLGEHSIIRGEGEEAGGDDWIPHVEVVYGRG